MKSRTISTCRFGLLILACSAVGRADEPLLAQAVTTASSDPSNVLTVGTNDAGTGAIFKVVSGKADANSGPLDVLHDGKPPGGNDDPAHNFFFAVGEKGGRITADVGKAISLKNVATYSWHGGSRAPQIYKLYASDGTTPNFNPEPSSDIDPAKAGWRLLSSVDTRGNDPGQHSVSISGNDGKAIGRYRHLLFDITANEHPNGWGNTFFNEIDIVDADGPELKRYERKIGKFTSKDGKLNFTVDSTEAPDLADWCTVHMLPVVEEWYPKIIRIIPVEDYTPPSTIHFKLRDATTLPGNTKGVPAFATGDQVTLNTKFMRDEAGGEAVGAVVHEIVHVVQFGNPPKKRVPRPPAWVTEGVADYIRWFLYEPQAKGAEVTKGNIDRINYDQSYRVTANFFDYVTRKHDKDLVKKLNIATHTGYSADLWKEWTGKSVEDLDKEWKAHHRKRLGLE